MIGFTESQEWKKTLPPSQSPGCICTSTATHSNVQWTVLVNISCKTHVAQMSTGIHLYLKLSTRWFEHSLIPCPIWVIPSLTSGLSEQLLPLNELSFGRFEISECSIPVYTAATQMGNSEQSVISSKSKQNHSLRIRMCATDFCEDSEAVCQGREKVILQSYK